jgi:hypothetical protein
MSLNFLLIEIRFLAVVRSAFVPSIAMISSNQVSIFKKRKEFEQIFLSRWILLSKVGYAMVVGYDGA